MRRLVGVVALGVLVGATAGCASAHPTVDVGAVAAPSPTLPASPLVVGAGPPTTTTVPSIGGIPVAESTLHSGAPPARSKRVLLRGSTWPDRKKPPLAPLALVPGGYEADLFVSREHDYKTGGLFQCSVKVGLVTTGGSAIFPATPQSSGVTARTFVVPRRSSAKVVASGHVGCDWVMMIYPA